MLPTYRPYRVPTPGGLMRPRADAKPRCGYNRTRSAVQIVALCLWTFNKRGVNGDSCFRPDTPNYFITIMRIMTLFQSRGGAWRRIFKHFLCSFASWWFLVSQNNLFIGTYRVLWTRRLVVTRSKVVLFNFIDSLNAPQYHIHNTHITYFSTFEIHTSYDKYL